MRPGLLRQCTRWMGGRADLGEEAFSRATLRALQRFPALRASIADPRGWLARLTYHACMDLHRELAQRASGNGDDLDRLGLAQPGDPESSLLHRERRDALRDAVARLPPRLRAPMEILLSEGSDSETIAAALRISPAAVRKRLQEARDRMRADLAAPRSPARATERVDIPTLPLFDALTRATVDEREVELLHEAPPRLSERAVAQLERYVARHTGGWKKRVELARAYAALGRTSDAIAQYERAARRTPAPLVAVFELIELLVAQRSLSRALEVCLRTDWRNDRWLGDAFRASIIGNVQAVRAALAGAPMDPPAALIAGRIALQSGLVIDAARHLARAPRTPVTQSLLRDAWHAARLPGLVFFVCDG